MGQYYKVILLAENADPESEPEIIRLAISPYSYRNGAKLMEHSYVGNDLVNLVEYLISRGGPFYKSRIVWAGDYADSEKTGEDSGRNLYHIASDREDWLLFSLPTGFDNSALRYIVNHTTKQYVDKSKCNADRSGLIIHPLPLLVSEGNGCGGGDYRGRNEDTCGRWSRDYISMETDVPSGFTELETDFAE
jgi:hypothetical protein